jgi:hypothetical protein
MTSGKHKETWTVVLVGAWFALAREFENRLLLMRHYSNWELFWLVFTGCRTLNRLIRANDGSSLL